MQGLGECPWLKQSSLARSEAGGMRRNKREKEAKRVRSAETVNNLLHKLLPVTERKQESMVRKRKGEGGRLEDSRGANENRYKTGWLSGVRGQSTG